MTTECKCTTFVMTIVNLSVDKRPLAAIPF